MKKLIIILFIFISVSLLAQTAKLDKQVYWVDENPYAILTIQMPESEMNLAVELENLGKKEPLKIVINKQINTTKLKYFKIDFKSIKTGVYKLKVYFGANFYTSIKFAIIKK